MANLWLNYFYFWKDCKPEGYMRAHVAGQIVYSIYRMILQENEILFPCHRRLEEYVAKAPKKPERIVELCQALCREQTDEACDAAFGAFAHWTSFNLHTDPSVILSRYTLDYEQWWNVPRPHVDEY